MSLHGILTQLFQDELVSPYQIQLEIIRAKERLFNQLMADLKMVLRKLPEGEEELTLDLDPYQNKKYLQEVLADIQILLKDYHVLTSITGVNPRIYGSMTACLIVYEDHLKLRIRRECKGLNDRSFMNE